MKPEDVKRIEDLEAEVDKVLLLKDRGVVRILCASVIANRLDLDPVWLLLVAASSGGKTELIQAISAFEWIYQISDLTVNTFASGQKKTGKETSLLLKMNNGIMAFKDFTSILSKEKEARKAIMSQLREIYDGEYTKRTGTGDDITWKGKIGAIAGATEAVYVHLEEMSQMGDRFIMYSIEQPDRLEVARRALRNSHDMLEKRAHLRACFKNFIEHVLTSIAKGQEEIKLAPDAEDQLLLVADFATRARSAVLTDFKTGNINFVPAPEMPMRVTSQLYTLAAAFIAMYKSAPGLGPTSPLLKGELSFEDYRILYKTAFDSIPKMRRNALYALAKYKGGVSTAGLAVTLELPTPSVAKYLAQVNALSICTRQKKPGAQGDLWVLKEQYRDLMIKLEGITVEEGTLMADKEEEENWDAVEAYQKTKEIDSLGISSDPEISLN